MGKSDIVYQMYDALKDIAKVILFNTDINRDVLDLGGRPYDYGFEGPVFIRLECIEDRIRRFDPDIIICCAGGLSFKPEDLHRLSDRKIIGIALSDPDVFPRTTSIIAKNFSLFYTNSVNTLEDYNRIGVKANLLPFAANPKFHKKMPTVKSFMTDILFIGNYRADRVEILRELSKRYQLSIYGNGWEEAEILSKGHIEGKNMIKAINSAKICLDFPRTMAGYDNVKIRLFEYGCCGALVFTGRIKEIEHYFTFDKEIIGYRSFDELIEKIDYYLSHPLEAEMIRSNMRRRCLIDHTWQKRWTTVLEDAGFE